MSTFTVPNSGSAVFTKSIWQGGGSPSNFTIGAGYTSVAANALENEATITSVVIGDSVIDIGAHAFAMTQASGSNLTDISLRAGTIIGANAFIYNGNATSNTSGNEGDLDVTVRGIYTQNQLTAWTTINTANFSLSAPAAAVPGAVTFFIIDELVITGTPTQGQTLTIESVVLALLNGETGITYQWNRDGTAISSTNSTTYTLLQADVGKEMTVTATYTDIQSATQTAISAATSAVGNVNDAPVITSIGAQTATEDVAFSKTIQVTDPDYNYISNIGQWIPFTVMVIINKCSS
jgi:hypothetical protein